MAKRKIVRTRSKTAPLVSKPTEKYEDLGNEVKVNGRILKPRETRVTIKDYLGHVSHGVVYRIRRHKASDTVQVEVVMDKNQNRRFFLLTEIVRVHAGSRREKALAAESDE